MKILNLARNAVVATLATLLVACASCKGKSIIVIRAMQKLKWVLQGSCGMHPVKISVCEMRRVSNIGSAHESNFCN